MNVKRNAEKEWLRKMEGGIPRHQTEDVAPVRATAAKKENTPKTHAGSGFQDVAGMDDLKRLVMEGFINVLNNKECAKAFGVTPPSLLFYGPSGCGKTYFAEKIAEEVGVNFMKIVPDDIASTLVHGVQEKLADVFRRAAKSAPTLIFFDEFDAMVPHRSNGNKMTRELKLVKVYVDQTFKNVSATCEFFYSNEETLEQCLAHSFELLGVVRSVFRRDKTELSE